VSSHLPPKPSGSVAERSIADRRSPAKCCFARHRSRFVLDRAAESWLACCRCARQPRPCHVCPDFEKCYPEGFSIVNATPDTLADVLRRLIADKGLRRSTGEASRAYAERVHDAEVVARRLLSLYEEL